MTFKDYETGQIQYELSQKRKETLSELEVVLSEATKQQIHQLLRLPDRIRTRYLEENSNYRAAIKELLRQRLDGDFESDDDEKRELMKQIVDGIEGVDEITAKLEALKKGKDNDGNGPNSDEEDAA